MKFVIHTGTNAQTLEYACFMAAVAIGLADRPKAVSYRFHKIPDQFKGSEGHASWLLDALQECDPSADSDLTCHIIADADTVLVRPGWDTRLHRAFLDEDASCVGVTYEGIGGLTSGDGPVQTYKDRPNLTWVALSPFAGWMDFDPRPNKANHLPIDTWHRSMINGLPVGSLMLRDVGWKFPEYLHGRGMLRKAVSLPHEKKQPRVVPSDIIHYSEEFHWDDEPFLVHQRGSSNRRFNVDPISKTFYDAASRHLMALLGDVPEPVPGDA